MRFTITVNTTFYTMKSEKKMSSDTRTLIKIYY